MANVDYSVTMGPEQPAKDPNFCYWAELYFLATLSHIYTTNTIVNAFQARLNGTEAVVVKKGSLSNVQYREWSSPRNVKTGQPTMLVLSGTHSDSIFIDASDHTLVYGRKIGIGFHAIDSLYSSVSGGAKEYIGALFELIQSARNRGEPYEVMYKRLAKNIITRGTVAV